MLAGRGFQNLCLETETERLASETHFLENAAASSVAAQKGQLEPLPRDGYPAAVRVVQTHVSLR